MRITLVGFGTIGIGVARALADRAEELRRRGLKMKLVAVVDSHSAAVSKKGLNPLTVVTRKKSTGSVGELRMNALEVISEVESDVIVELTPGNPRNGEPGPSHIREALKASRSVVTANKMPLAIRYASLDTLPQDR